MPSMGAFIGEHGSWDRSLLASYEASYVRFINGQSTGQKVLIVIGFVSSDEKSFFGAPVEFARAVDDALLIADDVGNTLMVHLRQRAVTKKLLILPVVGMCGKDELLRRQGSVDLQPCERGPVELLTTCYEREICTDHGTQPLERVLVSGCHRCHQRARTP